MNKFKIGDEVVVVDNGDASDNIIGIIGKIISIGGSDECFDNMFGVDFGKIIGISTWDLEGMLERDHGRFFYGCEIELYRPYKVELI